GYGIHAVAIPGWSLGSILKYVAQMGATLGAAHLRAHHSQGAILQVLHRFWPSRLIKRRPAAVGLKFRARLEELVATGTAGVNPNAIFMEQLTRPGSLRGCLTQHGVLGRVEVIPPLFIGLCDFVFRGVHDGSPFLNK